MGVEVEVEVERGRLQWEIMMRPLLWLEQFEAEGITHDEQRSLQTEENRCVLLI